MPPGPLRGIRHNRTVSSPQLLSREEACPRAGGTLPDTGGCHLGNNKEQVGSSTLSVGMWLERGGVIVHVQLSYILYYLFAGILERPCNGRFHKSDNRFI